MLSQWFNGFANLCPKTQFQHALSKLKRIQILFTKQFFVAKSLKLDGNNMATLILSLENGSDLVVAQATWLKVICIEGHQQEGGGNKCVAFWWWCNNVFQGQKNGNNLRAIHYFSKSESFISAEFLMLRLHLKRTSTFQLEISWNKNMIKTNFAIKKSTNCALKSFKEQGKTTFKSRLCINIFFMSNHTC